MYCSSDGTSISCAGAWNVITCWRFCGLRCRWVCCGYPVTADHGLPTLVVCFAPLARALCGVPRAHLAATAFCRALARFAALRIVAFALRACAQACVRYRLRSFGFAVTAGHCARGLPCAVAIFVSRYLSSYSLRAFATAPLPVDSQLPFCVNYPLRSFLRSFVLVLLWLFLCARPVAPDYTAPLR